MNGIYIVIAMSFFGTIVSVVLLVVQMLDRQRLASRIDSVHQAQVGPVNEHRRKLPKRTRYGKLDKRFKQAGITTDTQTILVRYFGLQAFVFAAISALVSPATGLVALAVIHVLALFLLKRKYVQRQHQFERQLTDAIQVISNAMKSGYSFFQALTRVVEDSSEPLCSAFGQVVKEMSLGKPMENAFELLVDNYPIEDLQLMVSAIFIQKEIGGNLADILDTMLETLRERQRIAAEVRALTAQGRLSGWIVSLLPVAIGSFLYLMNPSYIGLLFTTTLGRVMIGIALFNELMGVMLIKGIIKVEY